MIKLFTSCRMSPLSRPYKEEANRLICMLRGVAFWMSLFMCLAHVIPWSKVTPRKHTSLTVLSRWPKSCSEVSWFLLSMESLKIITSVLMGLGSMRHWLPHLWRASRYFEFPLQLCEGLILFLGRPSTRRCHQRSRIRRCEYK